MDYSTLNRQLFSLAAEECGAVPLLANAAALLYESLPDVNWAGFYLVEGGRLVLGPFVGRVACIHIAFGRGVCGTAAAEDRTVLVPDVHAFPGHIACDAASRAEIVVPLHDAARRVLGVLDIDSPTRGRFTEADAASLGSFARALEALVRWDRPYGGTDMEASALFAGGCFWCMAPIFRIQPGVLSVLSGYAGGTEAAPRYEDVKAQRTGHRECVLIRYDDARVSYERLLDIFLANIDPYDGGGQFIDRGASYAPAIFYADEAQRAAAEEKLRALASASGRAPAVALLPASPFYPAEEIHQNYDLTHPEAFAAELAASGRARGGSAR